MIDKNKARLVFLLGFFLLEPYEQVFSQIKVNDIYIGI